MPTDVMLALTNALPGRERELEPWYTEQRVAESIARSGFRSGQSFRRAETDPPQEMPYGFLTLFELPSGGAASDRGAGPTGISSSDAMEADSEAWRYEALAEVRSAEHGSVSEGDHASAGREMLVVMTNAKPGRDDEFNEWYDERHLEDVLHVIGGFSAALRFRRTAVPANAGCEWGYLAIYEIPPGRLQHCVERIVWSRAEREEAVAAGREPKVPISDAMQEQRCAWWCRAVTPLVAQRASV